MSKKYPDEAIYNKLVRDLIPGIIEADGLVVETRELTRAELINGLLDKLVEEAVELKDASKDEQIKEMSDVLEILRSLAEEMDIEWSEVEKVMEKRAEKRGRFKKGIFLIKTFREEAHK